MVSRVIGLSSGLQKRKKIEKFASYRKERILIPTTFPMTWHAGTVFLGRLHTLSLIILISMASYGNCLYISVFPRFASPLSCWHLDKEGGSFLTTISRLWFSLCSLGTLLVQFWRKTLGRRDFQLVLPFLICILDQARRNPQIFQEPDD